MTDIVVPSLGESVSEATILKWYKKPGDSVKIDELLLELETEKVTLEVNATAAGALENIAKKEGEVVKIGEIVGAIKDGAAGTTSPNTPVVAPGAANTSKLNPAESLPPAAQKVVAENNLDPKNIQGTGKDGRITKEDALNAVSGSVQSPSKNSVSVGDKPTEKVKMTRLRKTIAERLKESQNTAAILTTFNEIDMFNVINIRQKYKDEFEKKFGIKLGFMSFFVKAAVSALKEIPSVNAEIDGDYLIYKNYYDLGVAVGTEQGLVVPVVRNADQMSFAEVELEINRLGKKAREGKLGMDELMGGTFTISNGGVYGSLLSTPIINPPQSGILGMHKTMERPVAINGKVEIRPMMYVALSYDHRIIDGKEAVTFLVKVKEAIENPERLLFGL